MSLRLRLFLLFGALMATLMTTQWLMVRQLTRQTLSEFADQTLQVSRQLVDFFSHEAFSRTLDPGDADALDKPHDRTAANDGSNPARDGGRRMERQLKVFDYRVDDKTGTPPTGKEGDKVIVKQILQDFDVSLSGTPSETRPKGQHSAVLVASNQPNEFRLRIQSPGIQKDIEVSSAAFREKFDTLSTRLLLGTMAILLVGLALGATMAHRMLRPLEEMAGTAAEIAKGRWGLQVSAVGGGEIQKAIQAFNEMSIRLQEYDQRQKTWQQERQLSELGQIARSFAHTIRNPLNTLGLSLEELARRIDPDDEAAEELTRAARQQIRRVDQWIRSFLTLASREEGLGGPVDLRSLIEDIVLEAVQDGHAKIKLEEEGLDRLPTIHGVETEVRGMIHALATNAAEACGDNGLIQIRAHGQGDQVVIEVRDDGPGLAEEVRRQLFSPHVTTKPRGAGMGLYLTHRIAVTRYGGSLQLEPCPPHGVLATLTLSARPPASPPQGLPAIGGGGAEASS